MALIERRKREEGYTLVETLVAMAIFVSVLIPLVATIGNFFLDRKAETLQRALATAETEMSRTISGELFTDGKSEDQVSGFTTRREIQKSEGTLDITISVSSNRNPEKVFIVVHKSILWYKK